MIRRRGASYRFQLQPSFGFDRAREALPYLVSLGVRDLYLSPIFRAIRGSTHGYDVVDHAVVSEELGGEAAFVALAEAARAHDLGVMVDWVPNHMSVAGGQNAPWEDVLAAGPDSEHAALFDIEWAPTKEALRGRVLLPILGVPHGVAVTRGDIRLGHRDGRFVIGVYDRALPVRPESLDEVRALVAAAMADGRDEATARDEVLGVLNAGGPTEPPYSALERVLAAQRYRLAFHRVAADEINYRRFFDVNDLAAIRMEDPRIFAAAHATLFRLIRAGHITALRLDHVDGLADPQAYLDVLARETGIPIVVEKILEDDEELPASFPVDGTTGYEMGAEIDAAFVEPAAERAFTHFYRRFTGDTRTLGEHVYESKKHILRFALASEVAMLARALERIASADLRACDFTLHALTAALEEVITAAPVYRTYLSTRGPAEPADERLVRAMLARARRRSPGLDASIFEFLEDVLLHCHDAPSADAEARRRFTTRFQQITGPIMAKSLEDTAFYRYNRLVCRNEVGSVPERFALTTEELHQRVAARARAFPRRMVATSTHDSKRGEDVSARIAALTEMPRRFARGTRRLHALLRRMRSTVDGADAPSASLEYLFLQTAIGAIPFGWDGRAGRAEIAVRLRNFLLKAAHEAKEHTSWSLPNATYDSALSRFVEQAFASDVVVEELRQLAAATDVPGAQRSFSKVVLRVAFPGTPDTYQGAETWNQRLVDPDNRGPMDAVGLADALARLRAREDDPATLAGELLEHFRDGRLKHWITHRALTARRAHEELFTVGDYQPLDGDLHVIAFARTLDRARAIALAPRRVNLGDGAIDRFPVGDVWGEQRLPMPPGRYVDALTGQTHVVAEAPRLGRLLSILPVALLLAT